MRYVIKHYILRIESSSNTEAITISSSEYGPYMVIYLGGHMQG